MTPGCFFGPRFGRSPFLSIAPGNVEFRFAALLNNTAPGLFFRRTVVQACPSIDLRLLGNFFNGKDTDYSENVDVQFTQTISMMKTDNGWQQDR